MPLILFWLWSPGVSGLRFTLGDKGQLPQQTGLPGSSRAGTKGAAPRDWFQRQRANKRSSLNQLHPLQTCQQMEMSSSAPAALPLPGPDRPPGTGMFMAMQVSGEGSRQGKRPRSGINHNIYHICRGNGSGGHKTWMSPLVSAERCISGILEQLQQTSRSRGGDAPGDISQDTHRGGLPPSPLQ